MKTLTVRLILPLALVLTAALTVSAQDDYSMDNFNDRYNAAADEAATNAIYEDFIKNGTDLEVVRQIQSRWDSENHEAAFAFVKELADKNPESKRYLYLYGRFVPSDIEKIEVGRRVIAIDPNWPYGYRLMLATYIGSLFEGKADSDTQMKLKAMLEADGPNFAKLVGIDPKETYSYEFLSKYQVYQKDAAAALATLDKAKKLEKRWPSPIDYVNVKIGIGLYEEALRDLKSEADLAVTRGAIPAEQLQTYINYYYTSGLYSAGAFDQVVKYKMTSDGWETDNGALYDIACAYARSGDDAKAFEFLDKSLANGWERVEHISNDTDLERLHDDPRWTPVIAKAQANWDAGKPKRKEETLAAKTLEPSPDWTLEDKDGNMVSLASLKGNVLILDFWATWCGPCRMAMPVINEFVKANDNEEIRVFSVNVWEKGKKHPKEFMKENDYRMTLLYGNDDLASQYGVEGIPFLCVIDKDGNIRFKETGYTEGLNEKLLWWTEDLL